MMSSQPPHLLPKREIDSLSRNGAAGPALFPRGILTLLVAPRFLAVDKASRYEATLVNMDVSYYLFFIIK